LSLIIEALKRARDDAIRRQSAARGLPLAPVPRMRDRSRWLSFALVPLAAALVICILLLIDLYSRIPDPEPAVGTEVAAETVAPAVAPPAAVAAEAEAAPASQQAIPRAGAPTSSTAPPSPTTQPVATGERDRPVAVVPKEPSTTRGEASGSPEREPAARPVVVSPRPSPTASGPPGDGARSTQAREFVGQARLRDGQLVDLEGIAWSELEPFALLNGQVIGVGEFIRAYRVSEIQRDHVILEQDEDRVLLRLE
jgi:hypothetical protein